MPIFYEINADERFGSFVLDTINRNSTLFVDTSGGPNAGFPLGDELSKPYFECISCESVLAMPSKSIDIGGKA